MASFAPIRGTRSQVQATPIIDGQFLVETDQGVNNKIYMDEGSSRTIVGGNAVTGVLPQLYIYSETGSIVTVEDAGGTLIPTAQIGTDHWTCDVPDYGIYTVKSVLSGDTTTKSINVTDCMIYTIDDSHFHCNVVVTYPSGVGASCQISGGGETYSAPALNPPDTSYTFVVHGKNTTYTITTNVDGAIKTETVTTGTVLDQTYNVTVPYARVNLTVEMPPITGNITCTDGTTTITKVATPNMVFYLPNTGTWTFTGSDGTTPYDINVEITDFTTIHNEDLSSAPDGATVTPTDDIQTWLLCAKIRDKTSYNTMDDVFADDETLQKLINDQNACNYLVRSKTFMGVGLVPALTSASANVIYSSQTDTSTKAAFNAFDDNWTKSQIIYDDNQWYSTASTNQYLGYDFTTPVLPYYFKIRGSLYCNSGTYMFELYKFKLQYSDDNSSWVDASELITLNDYKTHIFPINQTNGAHRYWRIYCTTASSSSTYIAIKNLQFYSTGIIGNESAMRYIGLRNYAANLLTNDSDWCENITQSYYYKLVLNVEVPTMTADNSPTGEVIVSTEYSPPTYAGFKAFDNNDITWWHSTQGSATTQQYLGYDFGTDVVLKCVSYLPMFDNGSGSAAISDPLDFVVEAFDTSINTWIPLNSVAHYAGNQRVYITINNTTAYSKYRINISQTSYHSSSNYYARVLELQFHCRKDVTEGLNIYSAAQDTVSISDGSTTITCPTLDDGHGVLTTPLSAGTYTFTSSVAENPNNLNANDYYSKSVNVYKGMIAVFVMPDEQVLYWWGYKNEYECEDCSVANGWTTNYSYTAPTYNTNNVLCSTSTSNANVGIGAKRIIINKTDIMTVAVAPTLSGGQGGYLRVMNDKYLANGAPTQYTVITNTTGLAKYTQAFTTTYKNSACLDTGSSRVLNIYALVLE